MFQCMIGKKIETVRDKKYKNLKIQQIKLSLMRENMVWHMKKKVKRKLKVNSVFVSNIYF